MLVHLLNTSANAFCQYCPRREGRRRGTVLRSRCQAFWPSPTSPLDRKRTSKRRHHVWWVERFLLLFVILFLFLRRVHGCMGMDVWVNVFTMPFLCANSGPWRTMSRAWPAMSAITTSSGSTCPSHQESAWGAAVARQEKIIVAVARKAILAGKMLQCVLNKSTNVFCQYCPRREGLRRGAVLTSRCQASLPLTTTAMDRKRTSKRSRHVVWVQGFTPSFF